MLERIANRSLLPEVMFHGIDPDALMDARDDSFDNDWLRAAEAIEAHWEVFPANRQHAAAVTKVREEVFKRTFKATDGHHDLAASVSDDFEVICKRALLGQEVPFITGLEAAYNAHQIPH